MHKIRAEAGKAESKFQNGHATEYLNDVETKDFTAKLNDYFEATVEIPRIKVGERQTIDTLVSEEALLFAKFLRNERETWKPRVAINNKSIHE